MNGSERMPEHRPTQRPASNSEARKRSEQPERWTHPDPSVRELIERERKDWFYLGFKAGIKHAEIVADAPQEVPC